MKEVYKMLRYLGISLSKDYLKRRIIGHPDGFTFIAIQDTLNEVGIQSSAYTITKCDLKNDGRPFLAHFNIGDGDFKFFENVEIADTLFKDFDKYWSGNVLFIEKTDYYGNHENNELLKKEKFHSITLIIITILISSFILFFEITRGSIYTILITLTSIFGLYFGWLITQKEFGIQNYISDKICSLSKNTSCESVLMSRGAYIFNWLTWGDVGISYFLTSLLFIQPTSYDLLKINIYSHVSILGLVFPLYSLYYQWYVVKKWCSLCIGVLFVLIFNGFLSIYNFLMAFMPATNTINQLLTLLAFLFIYFMILFSWQFIKELYKKSLSSIASQIKVATFKRNPKIFFSLLENQEINSLNLPISGESIRIGDEAATYNILIACNPFCPPCANAHQNLELLLSRYPGKISITIRFLLKTKDESDKKTFAAKAIIKAAMYNPEEAIRDWYSEMSIEKFCLKHSISEISVDSVIDQHLLWSKQSNLIATPTFFVNGRQLPKIYNWKDFIEILDYELKQFI